MTAMPALDILFFDVDDTLYSTTAFSQLARRNAVRAMIGVGLRVSEARGVAELSEVVAEFSSNYPSHFGRLLDRLGPEAYEGCNPAVVIAAGVVAYHRTKQDDMQILSDVEDTLARLHSWGARLGVISAGLRVKQAEKLIRLGALPYFDPTAIFFSDQVGVSKPNPKLYAKVCDAVGVPPSRALYIGDRPTHDMAPAKAVGMVTVHYTGAAGKYAESTQDVESDHTLADMRDLLDVLRASYGFDSSGE